MTVKTLLSFNSSDRNIRLVRVSDYRPFDRYQIIVNRRVLYTSMMYESSRKVFVLEVSLYVSQLNLF